MVRELLTRRHGRVSITSDVGPLESQETSLNEWAKCQIWFFTVVDKRSRWGPTCLKWIYCIGVKYRCSLSGVETEDVCSTQTVVKLKSYCFIFTHTEEKKNQIQLLNDEINRTHVKQHLLLLTISSPLFLPPDEQLCSLMACGTICLSYQPGWCHHLT